ncbi:adenylate kinase family protein [Natronolimnobius baerhuensis]|uniref:Putative adenylate kinase n=1 Tax=Natronolimnobius baerhuensis TaxID=253108 RepID=A0A202EBG3_9EURY|nr:adenylate kinase family protein [Natronolimnobius baerhuensis]OVE85589.1 adenylate kinase [Natronolimnobius baerhuensis]
MRVAVTGTPGTGKTTASDLLEQRFAESESDFDVVHLNRVLEDEDLYTEVDADRESKIADLEALAEWLEGRDDVVVESHLAHHFDADRVAVLRCAPATLEERLLERGETAAKAQENAESEALDVILAEAVEEHGLESVYEIDTTDRSPEAVADALEAVVAGEREPSAGEVEFVGYLG